MKFEVVDNFLDKKEFEKVYNVLCASNFNWNIVEQLNHQNKDDICFAHPLIQNYTSISSYVEDLIKPIMMRRKKDFNNSVLEVYRSKVNLFLKSEQNKKYGLHNDIEKYSNYETIIYYVNDNNGGTGFEDGMFIKQKANRALIIYGRVLHESIGQTDTNKRINININYYRK
jgi:hypothetical protein